MFKRFISACVSFVFLSCSIHPVLAQEFSINQLPVPGAMVAESAAFAPLSLKGLVVDLHRPLEFQFIVDTGRGPQDTAAVKEQADQLVKYFLAGLTIPEGDLWVNLSPYEKDRITTDSLGKTELGRDLLAQDYILKQLTASLIYPEKDLGKKFWSRVYTKAQEKFGTTQIPVNTFNKVWILPDQAQVFENGGAAYVTKATLKVMLDEDYLSKVKHQATQAASVSSQIVREIILPEIEKEVNTGKNFASLRQIYDAMILAKWYKQTIQNGLLDAIYTNKKKTVGITLNDPAVKEQIYNRYLQAYKKGVFNYIKQDAQMAPRKYFSGGIVEVEPRIVDTHGRVQDVNRNGAMLAINVALKGVVSSEAMMSLKPVAIEQHGPQFLSPFMSGGRNNVGLLLPFMHKRSKRDWGIGNMGESSRMAIDVLKKLNQHILQELPFNTSSTGKMPYSVEDSRLIDPIYIDIYDVVEKMRSQGVDVSAVETFILSQKDQIEKLNKAPRVDYDATRKLVLACLEKVWEVLKGAPQASVHEQIRGFVGDMEAKHDLKIEDRILYSILKRDYLEKEIKSGVHWTRTRMWDWRKWEPALRDREPQAIVDKKIEFKDQMDFQTFIQFVGFDQFSRSKDYGRKNGVGTMVDMPYALDGSDLWLNPKVFGLKKENGYQALTKQGVPPEKAYPAGQFWQFFPYDWTCPDTIPFILKRLGFLLSQTDMVRLDHVLGFYRQYHFTAQPLPIKDILDSQEARGIWQHALSVGTEAAKKEAAKQMVQLLKDALLEKNRKLPDHIKARLPSNAIDLTVNKNGELLPSSAIFLTRPVPVEEYATEQAPAPWNRQYVVESGVFHDQQKVDMVRVTPDDQAKDEGFMYEYLFGDKQPFQENDSLMLAYFEQSPGDLIMSKMLELAQQMGKPLIMETLGADATKIQNAVERLGGTNLIPGIWGDEEISSDGPNAFHRNNHAVNGSATLALTDSNVYKERWEKQISADVKTKLLDEWFGKDQWPVDLLKTLSWQGHEQALDYFVYSSRARMAIALLTDVANLDDSYRPNIPGQQNGQFEVRVPEELSLDELKAAAEGRPSSELARQSVELIKNLTEKGKRLDKDADPHAIHVTPEVGGKVVQIRTVGDPFLVDVVLPDQSTDIILVTRDKEGQEQRLAMTKIEISEDSFSQGVSRSVSRWAFRGGSDIAGVLRFHIEYKEGDEVKKTKEGTLLAADQNEVLNPLDPRYRVGQLISTAVVEGLVRKAVDTPISKDDLQQLRQSIQEDKDRMEVFRLDKLTENELDRHIIWRVNFLREHWADFNEILTRKPELKATLLTDMWNYYLPYAQNLIRLKQERSPNQSFVVGVSAIQGAGKTTQGAIVEMLLAKLGKASLTFGIDDIYLTHEELSELREKDPRVIRRALTHDRDLGKRTIESLKAMKKEEVVLVPQYYKGAHKGDGDRYRWVQMRQGVTLKASVVKKDIRVSKVKQTNVPVLSLDQILYQSSNVPLPENMGGEIPLVEKSLPEDLLKFLLSKEAMKLTVTYEQKGKDAFVKFEEEGSVDNFVEIPLNSLPLGWRIADQKPDFIFFEGYAVGARPAQDEHVFEQGLPGHDTKESIQFAKDINEKLKLYQELWDMLDYLVVLHMPDPRWSLKWRDDAEEPLRKKGQGMSPEDIREFVYYFWRNVHPMLQIAALASDKERANQVVFIQEDHTFGKVVTPTRAAEALGLPKNAAMKTDKVALAKPWDTGGIDLNQIKINRTGRTVTVEFDPAQLSGLLEGGFQGFSFDIERMTPISSPFPLLGVNPAKELETLLAKV